MTERDLLIDEIIATANGAIAHWEGQEITSCPHANDRLRLCWELGFEQSSIRFDEAYSKLLEEDS